MAGSWAIRRGVASLVAHMLLCSFNAPLLELAKVEGRFPFETTLLPFLIESLKLTASMGLLASELGSVRGCGRVVAAELQDARTMARYAVPGLLYVVVNNANVLMLLFSSPVEVMMLGQLRVLFTAGLSWAILNKSYSTVQWAALVLLVSGSLELQLPRECGNGVGAGAGDSPASGSGGLVWGVVPRAYAGYVLNVVVCLASALASVYSQLLVRSPESIHLSNIKLYVVGTVLGGVTYLAARSHAKSPDELVAPDPAEGLTPAALLYVANMVGFGLASSHLLKELGAVVKLFSTAASSCLVVTYTAVLGLSLGRASEQTMAFAGTAIFTSLFIFVAESERRDAVGEGQGKP